MFSLQIIFFKQPRRPVLRSRIWATSGLILGIYWTCFVVQASRAVLYIAWYDNVQEYKYLFNLNVQSLTAATWDYNRAC